MTLLTFEDAYTRLEDILERMNRETISLDEALKLYEEADQLIQTCNKRLNDAEQKIEILLKNRNHQLLLDEQQKPMKESFAPTTQNSLSKSNEYI